MLYVAGPHLQSFVLALYCAWKAPLILHSSQGERSLQRLQALLEIAALMVIRYPDPIRVQVYHPPLLHLPTAAQIVNKGVGLIQPDLSCAAAVLADSSFQRIGKAGFISC